MASRKSILLRLRPEMYEALQGWAQDEFRSLNGQLEFLLDQALKQAGRVTRRPEGEADEVETEGGTAAGGGGADRDRGDLDCNPDDSAADL